MAVIHEYMNGSCKITVHDDYIKTPGEVERIIQNVSRLILSEELRRTMEKKQTEGTV